MAWSVHAIGTWQVFVTDIATLYQLFLFVLQGKIKRKIVIMDYGVRTQEVHTGTACQFLSY